MIDTLSRFGLKYNPFEPAASGAPLVEEMWIPKEWRNDFSKRIDRLKSGRGPKAIFIVGEYGIGKTYILQWLNREVFPKQRIKPFYFDNPGIQFYDIANSLFRQIGRKDLAKSIWELAVPVIKGLPHDLFGWNYENLITRGLSKNQSVDLMNKLQQAILDLDITGEEQIAYNLARLVIDTPKKPYFEYRDFVAGKAGSLVAEKEEAPYFKAILVTLRKAFGIASVAFLIDEFEEVAHQKRMTSRDSHEYFLTLKRLLNLAQTENLWLVLSMTPDAWKRTTEVEPATVQRSSDTFMVTPLSKAQAIELVRNRLECGRITESPKQGLFPFPENLISILKPANISNPRRLVKICFNAISHATTESVSLPFEEQYLRDVEGRLYPETLDEGRE